MAIKTAKKHMKETKEAALKQRQAKEAALKQKQAKEAANTMEAAKKQMKAEEANITEAEPLSQRQRQRKNDRSSRGRGRAVIKYRESYPKPGVTHIMQNHIPGIAHSNRLYTFNITQIFRESHTPIGVIHNTNILGIAQNRIPGIA